MTRKINDMKLNEGSAVVIYRKHDIVAGIILCSMQDYCTIGVPRCMIGVPVKYDEIINIRSLADFGPDSKVFIDIKEKYGQENAYIVEMAYKKCI